MSCSSRYTSVIPTLAAKKTRPGWGTQIGKWSTPKKSRLRQALIEIRKQVTALYYCDVRDIGAAANLGLGIAKQIGCVATDHGQRTREGGAGCGLVDHNQSAAASDNQASARVQG